MHLFTYAVSIKPEECDIFSYNTSQDFEWNYNFLLHETSSFISVYLVRIFAYRSNVCFRNIEEYL